MESLTLLSASESILMPSGYAVVMKNLLPRLVKRGWEAWHIGWQHQGLPQPYADQEGNTYVQLPPGVGLMSAPDFPNRMPEYLKRHKPDCVFSLIDYWYSMGMIDHTNEFGVPYVNYFPQDGDPFYTEWLESLRQCHTPLTQSKFGVEVVESSVKNYGRGGWTRAFNLDYLWHGVDPTVFHPLKKQQLEDDRQGMLKHNPDTFVIGVIGKNTMRKQHCRVMEAFSKFAQDKKDVMLMMKVGDPGNFNHQGNNLYDYARKVGLTNTNCRFIDKISDLTDGMSEVELNHIYNLFDVYVNGTSGEGFGIPTIESMATGTPVIITDYTCYSDDTEVITPEGPKSFSELKEGDLVWTRNFNNDKLEAKPIEKLIIKEHDGDMIHIDSRHVDLLLTPDHKVIARKQGSYNKWCDYERINAEDLLSRAHWKLPLMSQWDGESHSEFLDMTKYYKYKNTGSCPDKIKIEDFLELAGWYIAEGDMCQSKNCNHINSITIHEPKNTIYRGEICDILKRIGIPYQEDDSRISFHSTQIAEALTEFGRGSSNKKIPIWVKKLNKELLGVIYESINKGDGSKLGYENWTVYTTVSKQLAYDIFEISQKLGVGAFFRIEPKGSSTSYIDGRKVTNNYDIYRVNLRYKQLEGHIKTNEHIKKEHYSGTVWCISVKDNHNLLVGRNGRFCFCGNTGPEIVKDTGWIVPCSDYVVGEWNIKRGIIDIDILAASFQDAYDDRTKLKQLGQASLKRSRKFDWNKIVNKCDDILRDAVNRGALKPE